MDKNTVLTTAAENGYFRTKRAETKNEIAENLAKAEGWEFAAVLEILEAETARRAEAYRKREAAKIAKAQAEAAKPVSAGVHSTEAHIVDAPAADVYVITTAQNNTDVHREFMAALRIYCASRGALLLVGKTTYNKGAFLQPEANDETLWYDPAIKSALVSGHIRLTPRLHFFADANVIPTAKNPLSGFEGLTPAGVDCIIPAVKLSLKCVAALKGARGKVLHSTGAVTLRNYILRKAGAVAQAEHNISALVVEINRDGSHNIRQLEMMPDETGFYDMGNYYTGEGITENCAAEVLQFGDIHAEKMEKRNLQKCLDLIFQYTPRNVMIHDVLDFSSRNHHNIKDPVFIFKNTRNVQTVEGDIKAVARVLDNIAEAVTDNGGVVHIIESNHDLAIMTWLKNADFKTDPVNALVYLRCMSALYEHIHEHGDDEFNMLEYAYTEIGGGEYSHIMQFHETDESVVIAGIEHGNHGHNGANGSRGSPQGFRALGVPMNTGHTHTPSICGAVYTAGVSASLEMGYNVGASSWHIAHVLTWPNGQRQIIFA